MSNLESVWAATQADTDGYGEDVIPPAGTVGIARIAGSRTGQSKRGESYFAVDLKDDQGGYSWAIYKQFTKNGQPHEGSIKSAKITLRQLGLDVRSPSQLPQLLKQVEGRHYTYEQAASDRINQVTGMPYVNTNITGPASAPTPNVAPAAPAPQVQAPAATVVQTPQGAAQFPSALPQQNTDPIPF
jgi:hypothetical protein